MDTAVIVDRLMNIGTPLGNTVFGYHRGDMERAGKAAAEIAEICFAAASALSAGRAALTQAQGGAK